MDRIFIYNEHRIAALLLCRGESKAVHGTFSLKSAIFLLGFSRDRASSGLSNLDLATWKMYIFILELMRGFPYALIRQNDILN